ncbi:MAG TPA: hypothetical protein VL424_07985 [Pararobbsia sp.]|nr:hypothetical protein [Pararobbsia sp.]
MNLTANAKPEVSAQDAEARLLTRCTQVALGVSTSAQDGREANAFRLASLMADRNFSAAYRRLMNVSQFYFDQHPAERLDPEDVVRNGWVVSLPRLRDMLRDRLRQEGLVA